VTVKTPVTQTDYRQVDEALDELYASLKYVDGHVPNEAISKQRDAASPQNCTSHPYPARQREESMTIKAASRAKESTRD
jgi:hypothetical protein